MPIPQDFIAQLHDRNEITELIGNYVSLKRHGRIHSALCPFHNEKTPSFTVYPDSQSFYCFGCGTGGDVITFVMQRENLDYIEAVRMLAQRAGMAMPDDSESDAAALRKRLYEANKAAARFFFDQLNSDGGRAARKYLRGRGLSDGVIKRFGLGYAPEGWDALKNHLLSKGFRINELLDAGLVTTNQSGTSQSDFFRNRVLFPLIDVRGNVIAFSGRTLGDDPRKYINTRDTAIFKKSRALYALNIAKNTTTRRIIVAEGQMDVIAIHAAGYDNAVAALGTALTDEHARMIARYADEVVLAYDGDTAGQRAIQRAIETFKSSNLLVRVISMPGAKDPDEFIKNNGAAAFGELVEGSGNSIEFMLEQVRRENDLETDAGRIKYLNSCADILAGNGTPTERDLYAGRVATLAGVTKSAMLTQIEQNRKRNFNRSRKDADRSFVRNNSGQVGGVRLDSSRLGAAAAERKLIALLFANPDFCDEIRSRLEPDYFISNEAAAIYTGLVDLIQSERFSGLGSLSGTLQPKEISLLAGILAENSAINFSEKDIEYLTDKIIKPHVEPNAETIRQTDEAELMRQLERSKKKTEEPK